MTPTTREHKPFVPPNVQMKEFTLRAVLLGLVMCVVLGAANAYLGLRAGQTIAATYPAAVIGMAVLRIFKGSILEENIARTAGSIGESVAAGAIFTIPAFVISRSWLDFSPGTAYWKSTALMLVGSVLGVLFVSLVRRALVEDPELPFPESVAASQIHKAGQLGRASREVSLLQHGIWMRGVSSWCVQHFRYGQGLGVSRRSDGKKLSAARRSGIDQHIGDRRRRRSSRDRRSAPLISVSVM